MYVCVSSLGNRVNGLNDASPGVCYYDHISATIYARVV
jgi:hypothetical protein